MDGTAALDRGAGVRRDAAGRRVEGGRSRLAIPSARRDRPSDARVGSRARDAARGRRGPGAGARARAARRCLNATIPPRPLSTKLGAKPGSDVVVLFTTSRAELERRFEPLKRTLAPADGLW